MSEEINGDLVDRAARILDGDEPIPTRVSNGIIMAAVKQNRDEFRERNRRTEEEIAALKNEQSRLAKAQIDLASEVSGIKEGGEDKQERWLAKADNRRAIVVGVLTSIPSAVLAAAAFLK